MAISADDKKAITDAWQNKKYVYLTGDNLSVRFQTRIVAVKDTRIVLQNSVAPQYLRKFLHSKNFYLQILLVNFKASKIDSDGKNILITLEESLSIKETRQSVRDEYFPHREAYCKFTNPFDHCTVLHKRLMDLSEDGFSLITFVETKLFAIGSVIKNVEFFLKNRNMSITRSSSLSRSRSAKIRYLRTLVDIEGKQHIQVGFEFLKTA